MAGFSARIERKTDRDEAGEEFESEVQNLSAGGMFVRTEYSLMAGDEVSLFFDLPEEDETVSVEGIVRWTRRSGSEKGLGIEFTNVPESSFEKIQSYTTKKRARQALQKLTQSSYHRSFLKLHARYEGQTLTVDKLKEQMDVEDKALFRSVLDEFLDAGLIRLSSDEITFRAVEEPELMRAVELWREEQDASS